MYLERAAFSFGSEDFVAAYLHLEKIFSLCSTNALSLHLSVVTFT